MLLTVHRKFYVFLKRGKDMCEKNAKFPYEKLILPMQKIIFETFVPLCIDNFWSFNLVLMYYVALIMLRLGFPRYVKSRISACKTYLQGNDHIICAKK